MLAFISGSASRCLSSSPVSVGERCVQRVIVAVGCQSVAQGGISYHLTPDGFLIVYICVSILLHVKWDVSSSHFQPL